MTAIERIDGAMSRIEAAARQPYPALSTTPSSPGELRAFDELRSRHDTMRGRVEAAITELDTLIRNG